MIIKHKIEYGTQSGKNINGYNIRIIERWESLSSHERSSASSSAVVVVETTELLEEDKGEDSVWSEASVVGSESLPQTEEAFVLDQFTQNFLLWERGI